MSSVVPTYGLSVINDYALDEEVQKLEQACSTLRIKITEMSERIRRMFEQINSYNAALIEEFQALSIEAEELRAKISASIAQKRQTFERVPDDLDREFAESSADYDHRGHYTEDDFEFLYTDFDKDSSPESEELVALFRRIAAKTHPDKTPDTSMHVLFIRAKELRKARDLEGMKALYQQVLTGVAEDLERKLLIERLRQELAQLSLTLHQLRNSEDCLLLDAFATAKQSVFDITRRQLLARIQSLRMRVRILRSSLDEPEPEPVRFLNFIRG